MSLHRIIHIIAGLTGANQRVCVLRLLCTYLDLHTYFFYFTIQYNSNETNECFIAFNISENNIVLRFPFFFLFVDHLVIKKNIK